MKIINWAETKSPTVIKAGESADLTIALHAGDEDLNVGYVVVLDWEDISEIEDGMDFIPHIFMTAVNRYDEVKKQADLVPGLERIVAAQAQRIADLERTTYA